MFMRLDENDGEFEKADLHKVDFQKYDAVIVSDYDKGYLDVADLEYIAFMHPLTFLDTKKPLGPWSSAFSFVKINGVEYEKTKDFLTDQMRKNLITTRGREGCFYNGKQYEVPLVEVKDTSGAGDTFVSALCVEFCKSKNIDKAINFANQCATLVVQKLGVATP
jgi:sugar/nucleoside kinase (ribokinase family)